jgi:chromosome segregation ATPase
LKEFTEKFYTTDIKLKDKTFKLEQLTEQEEKVRIEFDEACDKLRETNLSRHDLEIKYEEEKERVVSLKRELELKDKKSEKLLEDIGSADENMRKQL